MGETRERNPPFIAKGDMLCNTERSASRRVFALFGFRDVAVIVRRITPSANAPDC
ncbi:hypothetical protein [Pseudomonas sp. PA15(2017)]|uniref:hypothetical protein n=1 Tax=Pseudomonas sp. PA15(2017) TaxID=1932111 RepID=UPI00143C69D0|nr:hypothetical protein [Pseudomonas sp. PA15(2017)]